jgi:hypothetical protein
MIVNHHCGKAECYLPEIASVKLESRSVAPAFASNLDSHYTIKRDAEIDETRMARRLTLFQALC